MAGGKFDKLAGKTRPGTYINFQSERTSSPCMARLAPTSS